MRFNLMRFTNIFLLAALSVLTLTGVYGLVWAPGGWPFDLHRIAGWVLIAALPWKAAISWRSLRRGLQPNFDRGVMVGVSLLLAVTALAVLALGLAWTWRLGPASYWLRQTALSWHWMLGLGLLAPLGLHAWRRWPRPKRVDFTSRRAFLRAALLGSAGLAGWWLAERAAGMRSLARAPRRFTGSRQDGFFSANAFPVTQSIPAREEQVALASWRLALDGAVERPFTLSYPELLALPSGESVAALDCTLGWYTWQRWRGAPLGDLLKAAGVEPGAAGVRLVSVTGYWQVLTLAEAGATLLATHVGGEPLAFAHGFPLRAVVPGRRGWQWVKWLTSVEVIGIQGERFNTNATNSSMALGSAQKALGSAQKALRSAQKALRSAQK